MEGDQLDSGEGVDRVDCNGDQQKHVEEEIRKRSKAGSGLEVVQSLRESRQSICLRAEYRAVNLRYNPTSVQRGFDSVFLYLHNTPSWKQLDQPGSDNQKVFNEGIESRGLSRVA